LSQQRLRNLLADELAVPEKSELLQAIPSGVLLKYLGHAGLPDADFGGEASPIVTIALLRSMQRFVAFLDDERTRLRDLLSAPTSTSAEDEAARLAVFLDPRPPALCGAKQLGTAESPADKENRGQSSSFLLPALPLLPEEVPPPPQQPQPSWVEVRASAARAAVAERDAAERLRSLERHLDMAGEAFAMERRAIAAQDETRAKEAELVAGLLRTQVTALNFQVHQERQAAQHARLRMQVPSSLVSLHRQQQQQQHRRRGHHHSHRHRPLHLLRSGRRR
jgi:hypothetical protein